MERQLRQVSSGEASEIAKDIYRVLGKTRIAINFLELNTALVAKHVSVPFYTITSATLPPSFIVVSTAYVAQNQVSIETQNRFITGIDHLLQLTLEIDGKNVISDANVVQQAYAVPTNFITEIGALYPAEKDVTATVTNTSSTQSVFFESVDVGANVVKSVWDLLIEKYFSVVTEELATATKSAPFPKTLEFELR